MLAFDFGSQQSGNYLLVILLSVLTTLDSANARLHGNQKWHAAKDSLVNVDRSREEMNSTERALYDVEDR